MGLDIIAGSAYTPPIRDACAGVKRLTGVRQKIWRAEFLGLRLESQGLLLFGAYNLPFCKGKAFRHSSKLAGEMGGGWNLGAMPTFQSGPPTQITGGYDTFSAHDGGVTFAPGVTAQTIQNAVGVFRTGNPWVDTINPKLLAQTIGSTPA
jgi:hypothetical protein